MTSSKKEITLSVLVNNHFGVLTKIASMFSRRGINIKSLAVGETQDPRFSRMTIHAQGDGIKLQQIYSQMHKLEDVRTVCALDADGSYQCGMVLAKLKPGEKQQQLEQLAREYGARLKNITDEFVMLEASGGSEQINSLIDKLRMLNVVELATSGLVALDDQPRALGEE